MHSIARQKRYKTQLILSTEGFLAEDGHVNKKPDICLISDRDDAFCRHTANRISSNVSGV